MDKGNYIFRATMTKKDSRKTVLQNESLNVIEEENVSKSSISDMDGSPRRKNDLKVFDNFIEKFYIK